MIRTLVIAVLLAMTGCATADTEQDSDELKVMFARSDGFHRIAGDGVAHCSATRDESCRPVQGRPGHQTCTYLEAGTPSGSWTPRRMEIVLVDDDWLWVSGEVGHCNLTVYGG